MLLVAVLVVSIDREIDEGNWQTGKQEQKENAYEIAECKGQNRESDPEPPGITPESQELFRHDVPKFREKQFASFSPEITVSPAPSHQSNAPQVWRPIPFLKSILGGALGLEESRQEKPCSTDDPT